MNTIRKIRDKIKTFEAMPVVCQQILAHMNDPHVEFSMLAEKIKYDPGMTANILKLANSAYFGATHKVESLNTAIVMLGMKRLFQVVVAQKTSKQMMGGLPGYGLSPEELLKHSVWTALGAEEFSRALNLRAPELLFTAGLLHDIGKVVLDPFVAEYRTDLLKATDTEETTYDKVERKIFGLNHADVGRELFARWQFPKELEAVALLHHEPEKENEHADMVTVVHLADMLAYSQGVGTGIDGLKYRVCEEATHALGLKGSIVERVASRTMETMASLEQTLSELV